MTIRGLIKINPQDRGRTPVDDCVPKAWYPWGKEVVIEPVPDDKYPLALYISDYPVSELTADTDIPSSLPLEFHECIVFFSCYTLLMKRKKWDSARYFYNRYLSSLELKYKIYMERKAEEVRTKQMLERRIRI